MTPITHSIRNRFPNIEVFEKLGWEFYEDWIVDPHNGDEDLDLFYKSPRMKGIKMMSQYDLSSIERAKLAERYAVIFQIFDESFKVDAVKDKLFEKISELVPTFDESMTVPTPPKVQVSITIQVL